MKKLLALLMAGVMLVSFAACSGNNDEEETTTEPEITTAAPVDAENEDVTEEAIEGEVTEAEEETEAATDTEGEESTDKESEVTTEKKEEVTEKVTKKPADTAKDPSKWSTEKILEYSNTALNKVKSSKAGYTKNAVMEIKGDVSGLPEVLKKIFQTNKTTTMAKGSDNTNDFPAAGFTWSSCLRPQDINKATLTVNGSTYDIMIKLGTEKNPGKGTASSYGRAMSVIDAEEAANMIPFGINSVNMNYHDGYIHIKVDSTTGRIMYAQLSAAADAKANLAIIGDVQADSITSTETFTNFVW